MASTQSELLIIAGPNGAGKTTFVNRYLPEATTIREFVNADLIAKGISPFDPERAGLEAGRIEMSRIEQFLNERRSFAVETTLSGKGAVRWMTKARASGYLVKLFYIYLSSPELSIQRIADRVRKGGHNIPSHVARRRFGRSIRNFYDLYVQVADDIQLFDNSSNEFLAIAHATGGEWIVVDPVLMKHVQASYAER
jgi:predicted ABC-type ATPase